MTEPSLADRVVLVDTSIWADHFRRAEPRLVALLADGKVRMHPFVLGELAMGNLQDRDRIVALLGALPTIAVVEEAAWLEFVNERSLPGSGLGFVDAHLLAAATGSGTPIWTRDRRLREKAADCGSAWHDH